jgi:hypothetical protein
MPERPRPEIDQVRQALREHDEAREDEPPKDDPKPPERDDEPSDD